MKKHELDSLKRWLDTEERHLESAKTYLANVKWYKFLYKRNMRIWIKRLEGSIELQREKLKQGVKIYYNL